MDRTKKLQTDLERTGMEKNLRNRGKSVEGGERFVHKDRRWRRSLRGSLRNIQNKEDLTNCDGNRAKENANLQ